MNWDLGISAKFKKMAENRDAKATQTKLAQEKKNAYNATFQSVIDAIGSQSSEDVAQKLADFLAASQEHKWETIDSVVRVAIEADDVESFNTLMGYFDIDPNRLLQRTEYRGYNEPYLCYAAKECAENVVHSLLKHPKIDIHARAQRRAEYGLTELMYSSYEACKDVKGREKVAKALLEKEMEFCRRQMKVLDAIITAEAEIAAEDSVKAEVGSSDLNLQPA